MSVSGRLLPGVTARIMPDYAQRRARLRFKLRKARVDGLLVTNFTNVTYLTGFTGEDSHLLVGRDHEWMLSDTRFTTQLEEECPDLEAVIRRPPTTIEELAVRTIRSAKWSTLAVEGDSLNVEAFHSLEGNLRKVELVTTTGMVEQLREIKDRDEIEEIERAVRMAERSFEVVRASLRGDLTEKQVADELDHRIRLFGGQGCSFPTIAAVGPRAALPHARPGSRYHVGDHPLLLVDWGARTDGLYVSDLTRVVLSGKPTKRLERMYRVVQAAQEKAIEAIRPGAVMEQIDRVARDVIEQSGWGKRFGHSLGHGIGLEVHEQPRLAVDQKRPLKAGMVVTVEPGIYIPGWGGIRIEDDVLVTRTGHRVLSRCPKTLEESIVS